KDALAGFKRYYKSGEVVGEVYTTINQPDYSAELAQLRAAKPDAAYVFYPGGMGVQFVKQYVQAGLLKDVPLFSAFTIDETNLAAIGDAAVGTFGTAFWNPDLKNPASERFVADFQKKYGYTPSTYSAQAYDAALLIDSAIRGVQGRLEDKDGLRAAFRRADFKSVRGAFRYNTNGFPIQNFYLHEVVKDGAGKLKWANRGVVFTDGEQGKPGFFTYVCERLNGFEPKPGATFSLFAAEVAAFPEYYKQYFSQAMLGGAAAPMAPVVCTGPVSYRGQDGVRRDIDNLKAALQGVRTQDAFMPAVAPSG